jgi:DNA gyrase subunit A
MEVGLVHKVDIDREMQQAYLDYAMSVIVARALPDARDGLKPVHRRILYAMYDMGMRPDSPYKKSARIVGEVLGKYHPHGDLAVYEAMARMAQDFSMRYLLVDGQGNFGSVDGDPPAAMRYTEARLAAPAMHILNDIGKDTVDFTANFDGTLEEPAVLPCAVPNLLINGATGIAVGMATSIPPHNLGEIVLAMQHMLKHWDDLDEINIEDLMQFVHGPDFPTGGMIVQSADGDGLISAYSTGRGRVTIQASAHLEEMERGRNRIIVTELPYMTNKAALIERIAELAREEKLEGIADLRDESDRQGMRIVIELTKTASPEEILRLLYKHTPMQTTFSIIMLALVDGEPRLLSLKQALRVFVEHRLEIVRRRSEYDLAKARQRAHILEGLRVALKNLDEVIDLIRRAPDAETARTRLMKRFKLSELQAQAILDMQLRRLAALERKKIEEEYKEVQAMIKELEALLRSPKKMRQVVSDELQAVQEAYGDRRRTHIVKLKEGQTKTSLLTTTELVPEKEVWLTITADGLISRSHEDKLPRLSGKEAPAWLARINTRDTLYLVCEGGEAAALPAHSIPENDDPLEGTPLVKATPLGEDDRLAAVFTLPPRGGREVTLPDFEKWNVFTVTRQGLLKKSALSELPGPSANLFTLVKVNEGDRLCWLGLSNGQNQALLATTDGMAIRFSEEEVRPMGLVAAGVMGIKLARGSEVAGAALLPGMSGASTGDPGGEVFMVTSTGRAKRVPIPDFPVQGRYGQGVQTWKLAAPEKIIGLTVGRGAERGILHMARLLPRPIRLDEAPLQTRAGRGHAIHEIKTGETVTRLTIPWESPLTTPSISSPRIRVSGTHSKTAKEKPLTVKETPTAKPTSKRATKQPVEARITPGKARASAAKTPELKKPVETPTKGAESTKAPMPKKYIGKVTDTAQATPEKKKPVASRATETPGAKASTMEKPTAKTTKAAPPAAVTKKPIATQVKEIASAKATVVKKQAVKTTQAATIIMATKEPVATQAKEAATTKTPAVKKPTTKTAKATRSTAAVKKPATAKASEAQSVKASSTKKPTGILPQVAQAVPVTKKAGTRQGKILQSAKASAPKKPAAKPTKTARGATTSTKPAAVAEKSAANAKPPTQRKPAAPAEKATTRKPATQVSKSPARSKATSKKKPTAKGQASSKSKLVGKTKPATPEQLPLPLKPPSKK